MAFDLNRVMAEDFLQVSESKWLWLLMDTCLDLDLMDIWQDTARTDITFQLTLSQQPLYDMMALQMILIRFFI